MTKFEKIGVDLQYDARSKRDADNKMRYSCDCCCHRGMKIDCDHCAIAVAHSTTIAAFDTLEGGEPDD